uniref:EF-hand domain-containing protein n=1 Tax=Pseudictyota dubia TaxID=2749911 RepID=A0A7R9VQS0_9STRA|mmetsp:Transcript_20797/g.38994  ORF Transcript_20797/g.38994 Transcript_20797/m.38994 type:complete len:412 (+) Transcript_20797:186-1421(+)
MPDTFTEEKALHAASSGGMVDEIGAITGSVTSDETISAIGNSNGQRSNGDLSVVAKHYDIGNKGYLDEHEKVLRKYDLDGNGHLDIREVYKVVEEVRRQQTTLNEDRRKIHNLKAVIIGLVVFTLILTLAMLGVSFAAATLAKDTTANAKTGSLQVKSTGESMSTIGATKSTNVNLGSTEPSAERMLAGEGMRMSAITNVSPLAQAVKKTLEQQRRQRERKLQCILKPCGNGNNNNNGGGNSDDELTENSINSINRNIIRCLGISESDPDPDPEFTISNRQYQRIYERHFEDERQSSVILVLESKNDGTKYQYTLQISESWSEVYDGEEDFNMGNYDNNNDDYENAFMLFLGADALSCRNYARGDDPCSSNCQAYQPIFFIGFCGKGSEIRDNECGIWTCANGVEYMDLYN